MSIRAPKEESGYELVVTDEIRQLRTELAQLALQLSPTSLECPTLAQFAPRFLEDYAKANRQKPRGIDSKESILRLHLLPRFGPRRLDSFEDADIQHLKAELAHLSPKTVNNVLCVLSRMLKVAVRWKIMKQVPVTIDLLPTDLPEVEFYEFDQYDKLVGVAQEQEDLRALAVVLLGGDAGLRCGEMIALEWGDIDWRRELIHIRRSESDGYVTKPKGGKARKVPITKKLFAALAAIRHRKQRRVLVRDDGNSTSKQTLHTWMAKIQSETGLSSTGGLHILRHTFCSHLAMRGAPMLAIKELAGHTSLRTTARYMHLAPSEGRRAISLLDAARHDVRPQPHTEVTAVTTQTSKQPRMTLPGFEPGRQFSKRSSKNSKSPGVRKVRRSPLPKLYTTAQVARLLGVCTKTVYRLIHHGPLTASRFGKTLRVTQADLEAFIAESRWGRQ